MKWIKKILSSRWVKILFSVILFCIAFKKVNFGVLAKELVGIPIWVVLFNLFYSLITYILNTTRWGFILFEKISFRKIFDLTKINLTGSFYSLMLPMSGDLIKWIPLEKKYPDLTKAKLLGSVALERIIDFTALSFISFIAIVSTKLLDFKLPDYAFLLSFLLLLFSIVFYILVFVFDIEKISRRIRFFRKYEILSFLKNESKKRIIKAVITSLVAKLFWLLQVYLLSEMLGVGFTLISVFVFIPIISFVLLIPVSVAGLGLRDNLYVYFFSQLGIESAPILSISILIGAIRILLSLVGGLITLFNKNQAKA